MATFDIETVKCTYYSHRAKHGKDVKIIDILSNERYTNHKLLKQVREQPYQSKEYKDLKANLSAMCVSSLQNDLTVFHSEENHLAHTGLIQFDIDPAGNPQLLQPGGYDYIKNTLIDEVPYIGYLGRSVSGLGMWGVFPILDRDNHDGHFQAMKTYFAKMNITIDSVVSNVAAFRFVSYDPDAYFELNPEIFDMVEEVPVVSSIYDTGGLPRLNPPHELFEAAFQWVSMKHEIIFEPGYRHKFLTFLYATLRYARVQREDILAWVYDNLISESEVQSNCLDELDIKSKL